MDKKRLAIIITSLEVGGAEKLVVELAKYINKDVFDICVFVLKKNKNTIFDKALKGLAVRVIYINKRTKVPFDCLTCYKLTKALKKFRPAIIHTHVKSSLYILLYLKLNKEVKWVHTMHTLAAVETKGLRKKLFSKGLKSGRLNLVCVSNFVLNSVLKMYKVNPSQVHMVYNGIFITNETNKKVARNDFIITHIGSFVKVKNHNYIINEFNRAFKTHSSLRLFLIGDGKLKKKIEAKVNKLHLTSVIVFVGYTDDVTKYLHNSDLFILPSLYEGFSLALLEAMSCGCPVIASKAGGNCEVISNYRNGLLIDLKKNELANAIIKLFNNENLRDEMRTNNLKDIQKYNIIEMIQAYERLYLTL